MAMSARGGVVEAVRATELMRLKAAGVPIGERFRRATRNGALRAAVFGVNDGLVSSLALIMGLTGAGTGRAFILLAGTAGLLAGALSMAAGEYVSVRVQREVGERVLRDERAEIARDPAGERAELAAVYRQRGFSDELAERMAAEAMANPALALEAHVRDELSIDPDHLGWPWAQQRAPSSPSRSVPRSRFCPSPSRRVPRRSPRASRSRWGCSSGSEGSLLRSPGGRCRSEPRGCSRSAAAPPR